MKKLALFIALFIISCTAFAQQKFEVNGSTYKTISTKDTTKVKTKDIATPYTYETNGKTYQIMMGKTGSCYIIKTSSKTGKEYKQYLSKEISQDICQKMGREYRPKTTK